MHNIIYNTDFMSLLADFSRQVVPVVSVIALVILCVALWELVKFIKGLDVTVNKINTTIDSVDQSIDKIQVPLDTIENLSHSIDNVHELAKRSITKSVDKVTDNINIIKDWANSLFKKDDKEVSETVEEDI